MKLTVIIPTYNEEQTISQVIRGVKKYTNHIIVVDDGSVDQTHKLAEKEGALVYQHIINRGLGGALETGFQAALLNGADILLTLDADGQHQAKDIPRLVKPIIDKEADLTIGSRVNKRGMPLTRRVANLLGNLTTFLLFGNWVKDSQSGFRCFNKKAAQTIQIRTNGMEVSSEIIKEIRRHQLRLKEVPIKAIYTPYSLSKGQGFTVGLKTFSKLLFLKFKK